MTHDTEIEEIVKEFEDLFPFTISSCFHGILAHVFSDWLRDTLNAYGDSREARGAQKFVDGHEVDIENALKEGEARGREAMRETILQICRQTIATIPSMDLESVADDLLVENTIKEIESSIRSLPNQQDGETIKS